MVLLKYEYLTLFKAFHATIAKYCTYISIGATGSLTCLLEDTTIQPYTL